MGDPKLPRRAWRRPRRPLNYDLKMEELRTLGQFGLRTKRELWKAHTELSRVRNQSRSLLALGEEARRGKESVLIKSLSRAGLVAPDSTLDDILNLRVTDLLARRLQTVVMKKLGFATPYQARQAVTHGHIAIGGRIVDRPSYTVSVEEEPRVDFAPGTTIREAVERAKKAKEEREARSAAAAEAERAAAEAAGAPGAAAAGGAAAPAAEGAAAGAGGAAAGGGE